MLERRDAGHRRYSRGGLDGDVLELVGDDVGPRREAVEPFGVAVLRDDELTHRPRARVGRGVEEPEVEPERNARQPQHAAELPAADAGDERHGRLW